MSEQFSDDWISIKDKETGCDSSFPSRPLEMAFDVPFQNTPPKGKIRIFSYPLNEGILILTIFNSPAINAQSIGKKAIRNFFETILVPHLFYNPPVFEHQQTFHHTVEEKDGEKAALFQITYNDNEQNKRIEGNARVKHRNLYLSFYLAPELSFDNQILHKFLNSIRIE